MKSQIHEFNIAKSSVTNRPVKQVYSNYTEHDFLVWKTLFNRQMEILKPIASAEYLDALRQVKFSSEKIPDFGEVAELLKPLTGWSIHTVPSISPQKEFFEFLSQKKFTSTCWLRTMEQLDYLEEPDMFHDVFAHVPLLSNRQYVNFFKGLSDIALKHIDDPHAVELLGRIYWFTIEFGLIIENDEIKVYGAGILSSKGEAVFCMDKKALLIEFDVDLVLHTDFRTDVIQDKYFVIESFDQLYNSLPEIELLLEKELEETKRSELCY
ncbi:MAG: phenylalanine 4-monooxygenase [Bacteroidia bacterium]